MGYDAAPIFKLHHEENPSHLTEGRIRELESVGFVWDPNDAVWSVRLRDKCVDSRRNSTTVSCHTGHLTTPSSGGELGSSDTQLQDVLGGKSK